MKKGFRYTLVAVIVAAVAGLAGGVWLDESARSGVWVGAAVALVVQVGAFWLLFVWALPERSVLAHGLGMVIRMVAVGVAALVWLPRAGLPAAPTLFSLVAVLFLTTLSEPLVLRIGSSRQPRPAGAEGR